MLTTVPQDGSGSAHRHGEVAPREVGHQDEGAAMRGRSNGRNGCAARRSLGVGVALVALVTACSDPSVDASELPDRPADLEGTVAGEPLPSLVDTSPREDGDFRDVSGGYFEGMSLRDRSAQGDTIVVGHDGRTVTRSDLAAGDTVEVWIGDECAESVPVQCEIVAIRVVSRAG
ncbi:hypothetical protein [Sanguibacter suaedae]|uniref:DUF5666 domain-containing protein n=1 Tax=Sanguibacter suaedae TaxID=2795737 RepID=A0A934I216_9MICO|nr:hypothetical protein [Sanguibacter suaedae]MBI9113748.1 hypothetical protein [Sanguibacter suaedae]